MTNPIERLRYYDGEYLRAQDFQTEQDYHVEMRRRLNMGLHLFGIVEGLQLGPIPPDPPNPNAPTTVTISAGMAIDAFGREIFLLSPYTLDDPADLDANRITKDGVYEVYIKYVAATVNPPSSGYADCDQTSELTRTQESSRIVLIARKDGPGPVTPPAVTDPISEDPDVDDSPGVYLGLIRVSTTALTGTFSLASVQPIEKLFYVGLRGQRIEPPNFNSSGPPNEVILSGQPAMGTPSTPDVEVTSNLFVDQNFVVGANFQISSGEILPKAPKGFPTFNTGNGKFASDLFVQGQIYNQLTDGSGNWMGLPALIQSLTPDVLVGTVTIDTSASPGSGPITIQAPSLRLTTIKSAAGTLSLNSFELSPQADISDILSSFVNPQFSINLTYNNVVVAGSNCTLNGNWSVSPTGTDKIPAYKTGILSLTVSYTIVCYPN